MKVRSRLSPQPLRPPMAFLFTGAGLSADSGVPTFHGSGGAYGQFDNPEEIVSATTLKRDPRLLNRFVDDMRAALGAAAPNPAHSMIAELGAVYGRQFEHMTQNIDDLVERAGYDRSVHLHGFLTRMREVANPKRTVDIGYRRYWDGDPADAPDLGFQFRGKTNNSWYRPDVVLFEEQAPLYEQLHRRLAIGRRGPVGAGSALAADDIAIVIGTRGAVVPIGHLLAARPCKKVLVNLHYHDEIGEHLFDTVIHDHAGLAAESVKDIVRGHLGTPVAELSVESDRPPPNRTTPWLGH